MLNSKITLELQKIKQCSIEIIISHFEKNLHILNNVNLCYNQLIQKYQITEPINEVNVKNYIIYFQKVMKKA